MCAEQAHWHGSVKTLMSFMCSRPREHIGSQLARAWRTGAQQQAATQLVGGRGCCPRACARAAAELQHAVLVRGPDQSYSLALQVADAPEPGSNDAPARQAQARPTGQAAQ